MSVLERLGLAVPVIGAGLGGGLSTSALTIALGRAGALGQIGILPPDRLRAELDAHRAAAGGPVAVNVLLPFARRAHWEAARSADAVVTFWGVPRRPGEGIWIHQCGSVEEARAAASAGADAVIVQGLEAGGHVRGTTPALELTAHVRAALRPDVGWPAPHRVIHNAATRRWLHDDPRGPAWVRALHRATAPVLSRAPVAVIQRAARLQRPGLPLLGPAAATVHDPVSLVDSGPLYAGQAVARIDDIRPAAEIVAELAPA